MTTTWTPALSESPWGKAAPWSRHIPTQDKDINDLQKALDALVPAARIPVVLPRLIDDVKQYNTSYITRNSTQAGTLRSLLGIVEGTPAWSNDAKREVPNLFIPLLSLDMLLRVLDPRGLIPNVVAKGACHPLPSDSTQILPEATDWVTLAKDALELESEAQDLLEDAEFDYGEELLQWVGSFNGSLKPRQKIVSNLSDAGRALGFFFSWARSEIHKQGGSFNLDQDKLGAYVKKLAAARGASIEEAKIKKRMGKKKLDLGRFWRPLSTALSISPTLLLWSKNRIASLNFGGWELQQFWKDFGNERHVEPSVSSRLETAVWTCILGPFQLLLDTHYQKFMFWDQAIPLSQNRSRKIAGTKSTSKKNPFQIRSRKFAGTKSTSKKNPFQIRSRKFAGTKFTSKKTTQKKKKFKFVPANLRERNSPQKNYPKKKKFKFVPAKLRERNPPPKKIPFKFVPANLRERNSPQKKFPFKFVPANLRERNSP
ncbi:hypothetical protein DFH07DRAFT_779142 [Mycena maculata]|uniref:Uncharacterized protein n=1 Tax=Mycena maculata TaxID=230809 RepID=A0AAD7IB56_9AGAR|nr:hypothetical protein DFH07DRAFT_779142 [Mycena maculata]